MISAHTKKVLIRLSEQFKTTAWFYFLYQAGLKAQWFCLSGHKRSLHLPANINLLTA